MQAVRTLWRFASSHKAITAMLAVFAVLISALLYTPKAGPAALLLPVGALIPIMLLSRYERVLDARISADSSDFLWDVHANGVYSGVISDAEYAAIRRDVYFSPRTYGEQLGNVARMMMHAVDYLFVAVPLSVFWTAVFAYVYARDDFSEFVTYMLTRTPKELASMMPHAGSLLVLIGLLCVIAHLLLGRRFGFRNVFEDTVADTVRRKIGCPAIGPISLSRYVDGIVITSLERELLFPHKAEAAETTK
jgi:hypothetical protein